MEIQSSNCVRYYQALRRKKRKERARCDTWDRYLVLEDDSGKGHMDVGVQVGCKSLDRHQHPPTIWDVTGWDEADQVGLYSFGQGRSDRGGGGRGYIGIYPK